MTANLSFRETSYDMTQGRDLPVPDLSSAFTDPAASFFATEMFIDIANSTEMKVFGTTGTWSATLAHFYKLVCELAFKDDQPMPHLKFLGDGVLVTFHTSAATRAINLAIELQERLRQANLPRSGQVTADVQYDVSIGIADGLVLRFRSPDGGIDHVGPSVDLAARLCSAANPKAILVHTSTVDAAHMGKVESPQGALDNRTGREYKGEVQRIHVKGRPDAQEYHEVMWSTQLFGVKSAAATDSAVRASAAAVAISPSVTIQSQPPATRTTVAERAERFVGKVKMWNSERGFGFLSVPESGEDFYFSRRSLCFPEDTKQVARETLIAFTAAPAVAEGKCRLAVAALVVGREAEGVVTMLSDTKPFGFISVEDASGHKNSVYMPIGDDNRWVKVGDEIGFDLIVGPNGPRAVKVGRLDEDTAA